MPQALRWLSNLPIRRKLLLASILPILAVMLLSLVTYLSVQAFSEDEEQLNSIYLVQRKAAEYMRLVLDMQAGFRGYVLTRQESFLSPYRQAEDHVLAVGDSLASMVSGREPQHQAVLQVQALLKRHIAEKDRLITAIKAGRLPDAMRYVEEGRGEIPIIRERMESFDRLEQQALNEALNNIARDRSLMMSVILWGGVLSVTLMMIALHLIARSITDPLIGLARAMGRRKGARCPTCRFSTAGTKSEC